MTALYPVATPAQEGEFLDAADAHLDAVGPAAFSIVAAAASLDWTAHTYLPLWNTAAVFRALVARSRAAYAFRLRAAGLDPTVVTWLLDHDPTTVIGLAYALDRTGGEDAWDLPVGFVPAGAS